MISPDNRRYAYGKAQLIEVICQLRFPTILSIDTREPADFQETVREAFPRYQCQVEKITGGRFEPNRLLSTGTFHSSVRGYLLTRSKLHELGGFCRPSRRTAGAVHQDLPSQLF